MTTLPTGAATSSALREVVVAALAAVVARLVPSGARAEPAALTASGAADVLAAVADTSRLPEPQKRHAVVGRHCVHCMLAVAAAATTRTTMTPAAMRPALLECITMQYLAQPFAERLPNAEVIAIPRKCFICRQIPASPGPTGGAERRQKQEVTRH
jgi:hypothetical protein